MANGLDLPATFHAILRLLQREPNPKRCLSLLAEYCHGARPDPGWSALGRLDVEGDLASLQTWFDALLVEEPPGPNIRTLWFGLFNPVWENEPTAGLYLSGAVTDAQDEDFDPADYWPEGRYARSSYLESMYAEAYVTTRLKNDMEYPFGLAFGALAAHRLTNSCPRELVLGEAPERLIAVGFDGGDILVVARVTPNAVESLWTVVE